jgi:3-oxoacyl-[acyl-carrier-protein] synthase-1
MGPLLLGLAAIAIEKGRKKSPVLVFCSSDRERRGAALLVAAERS